MTLAENDFLALAETELQALEHALDHCNAEIDYELQPGGILELEFENGSKIIINRHAAAREIWVAAKSGGFHFRPIDGEWRDTRDQTELWYKLSCLCTEQANIPILLKNT